MENVTSHLSGKKVLTVIDLKYAFWLVPLSEESAPLITLNTPFERYFFTRMPFGFCSASKVGSNRQHASTRVQEGHSMPHKHAKLLIAVYTRYSAVTSPTRSLLKAEEQFTWNTEHEDAFNKVNEILSTSGLRLFDLNLKA